MTRDGEASRGAIVQAAFNLFGERGVHKVDVSEICKRAGVSRAAFYLHFKNRDEIIAYGMRQMVQDFWARIGASSAGNDVMVTVQHYLTELVGNAFFVHGASLGYILEL